jgi:hypothetical protein
VSQALSVGVAGSGWLGLLRLGAVLGRHGVRAIRPVHYALLVDPPIDLTVARRGLLA